MMSSAENEPGLNATQSPAPTQLSGTSLPARLLNLIAMPGTVFQEVCQSRHSIGNWLMPALLCGVLLAIFAATSLSQPAIWKSYSDRFGQARAAQAGALAEAVKAGRVTQAEMDSTLALIDKVGTVEVVQPLAAAGGFAAGAGGIFWRALILWLLARVFVRTRISFGKSLEVAGLASMITFLGTALSLVLTMNGANISVPAAGGLLSSRPAVSELVLSLVDYWQVAVLGIGLGRLTGLSWPRGILLVFGYWLATGALLQLLVS
jgi:hypothetical protein